MCACKYVYTYIHIYIYKYIYIPIYICLYIYVYVYIYACMLYVYMCKNIHTHTDTHIFRSGRPVNAFFSFCADVQDSPNFTATPGSSYRGGAPFSSPGSADGADGSRYSSVSLPAWESAAVQVYICIYMYICIKFPAHTHTYTHTHTYICTYIYAESSRVERRYVATRTRKFVMSAHTHELCLCTHTQKVAVWNIDTWQPGQEIDQAAPADNRDYSSHSSSEEESLSFLYFLISIFLFDIDQTASANDQDSSHSSGRRVALVFFF